MYITNNCIRYEHTHTLYVDFMANVQHSHISVKLSMCVCIFYTNNIYSINNNNSTIIHQFNCNIILVHLNGNDVFVCG